MSWRSQREQVRLLLQVARWYYLEELNQSEIAERIGYSRPAVSRLLSEARAKGIVSFKISHPIEREMTLEQQLIKRFGLQDARVVEPTHEQLPLDAVASVGAEVLLTVCRSATLLATSAGTTIDALARRLPIASMPNLCVVQMIGSLYRRNPIADSPDIARLIAERLGADYRHLPAPLVVRTPNLATELRKEEPVANALALASHADVALVGIGATDSSGNSGPIFEGWLTPEEGKQLAELGAVGHVTAHHFDTDGVHTHTDLCDRLMSVTLVDLVRIKTVVAVACGQKKVAAISGALHGDLVDVLVTDAATAQSVLRHCESPQTQS